MLIKIPEFLSRNKNLQRPHRGVVVSNTDPKKLGRVKVSIEGLLTGDTTGLPWVHPQNPFFLGGKLDSAQFSVPELGSSLEIIFPFDDINFPFYTGYWNSLASHCSLFDTDYPNSYGFKDSTNTQWIVNKTKLYAEFIHSSGMKWKVDQNGNIELSHPGNMEINTEGNFDIKVGGNFSIDVGGNYSVKSGGTISEEATGVHSSKGSSVTHG